MYSYTEHHTLHIMFLLQVLAISIAAYHAELYFAQGVPQAAENQPVAVCPYNDVDDDYYGYRICANSIAASIVSLYVGVVLLIIDLLIPCLNTGVSKQ